MLSYVLTGALCAVVGCVVTHFVRAWQWRRSPLGRALEQSSREALAQSWTEKPLFRGRQ